MAGKIRKTIGYFLPFLQGYDAGDEAKELMRDREVKAAGITLDEVTRQIEKSYQDYKMLFTKIADSVDTFGVPIGGSTMRPRTST